MREYEIPVDPDAARLLENLESMGGAKLRDLSLADARAAVISMGQQLDLPCTAPCETTPIDGASGILGRLYSPGTDQESGGKKPGPGGPVILYIHGGGWITGNLDFCDSLCRHLATRSGHRVLSVDYRLAPEHPFPAAFEDVEAAARWVSGSPHALGSPVTGIALAGDSAGGGLAAAVAHRHAGDARLRMLALLLFYPVTDISRTSASYERFRCGFLLEAADMQYFAECYAPTAEARSDPRASPLLAENLEAMPPTSLLACGLDVLRDEGRAFAARLAGAGVDLAYGEARGHLHGIATLRGALPSARVFVDRAIDDFLRQIERSQARLG
jgi:acetyl esterase